jgi:hypothetical protein
MNPNLIEQFLGPSSDFFHFNQNDINILVTPIDRKTSLLTKRNLITTGAPASSNNNSDNNNNAKTILRASLENNYPSPIPKIDLNNSLNDSRIEKNGSNRNRTLSSSSTSKLKDKYKHIKSTIPPPRPASASHTNQKNRLKSKSNTHIIPKNNYPKTAKINKNNNNSNKLNKTTTSDLNESILSSCSTNNFSLSESFHSQYTNFDFDLKSNISRNISSETINLDDTTHSSSGKSFLY